MLKQRLGSVKRYLLNRLDPPALVLLYHRVTTLQQDPQFLSVSPENFYDQVAWLRKNYTVLPVEDFYQHLHRKKKMPRRAVMITFDDGYADNYLEALPILESENCQALFYITTSLLNTDRELWWDELERVLLSGSVLPDTMTLEVRGKRLRLKTFDISSRFHTYHALQPLLRFFPPVQREEAMDQLHEVAGLSRHGRQSHRMLTYNELQQLCNSPVAVIGAHTHNHPSLATLSYNEQLQEMNGSKDILEKITGKKTDHFSFPYGSKKDYNRDSLRACREIGFKMACANHHNQVHRWTGIFQVPRVLIRNWNLVDFKNRVAQFFHY